VDYIKNKPNLASVATSGDYDDLSNKPTIPAAQVQSDWTEQDTSSKAYIQNKPSLATVATSGNYSDLNGTPTIPTPPLSLVSLVSLLLSLRAGKNPLRAGSRYTSPIAGQKCIAGRTSSVGRFNTQDFSCCRSTRTLGSDYPGGPPVWVGFKRRSSRGGHTSRAFSPVSLSPYRVRGCCPPLSLSFRVVS
jgi:hypothetical protein